MGKQSSSKKVAKVARTGGGRTRKGSASWLWPGVMALVVILGTAGVVLSRDQRQPDDSPPRAGGLGREGDHWHAAIGFYICGEFAPDIQDQTDPLGIHTHGDGVVHVHPFTSRAAGRNATLSVFFDAVGARVSDDELRLPGRETHRNGDECDGEPAQVQMKVWPSRDADEEGANFDGDPGDLRLRDNQLITVAFVPDGTEIPRPESEAQLDRLTDLATIPVPNEGTTTTTGPDGADGAADREPAPDGTDQAGSDESPTAAETTTTAP